MSVVCVHGAFPRQWRHACKCVKCVCEVSCRDLTRGGPLKGIAKCQVLTTHCKVRKSALSAKPRQKLTRPQHNHSCVTNSRKCRETCFFYPDTLRATEVLEVLATHQEIHSAATPASQNTSPHTPSHKHTLCVSTLCWPAHISWLLLKTTHLEVLATHSARYTCLSNHSLKHNLPCVLCMAIRKNEGLQGVLLLHLPSSTSRNLDSLTSHCCVRPQQSN